MVKGCALVVNTCGCNGITFCSFSENLLILRECGSAVVRPHLAFLVQVLCESLSFSLPLLYMRQ